MHRHSLILMIVITVLNWACDSPPAVTRPLEGAQPPPQGARQGQSLMSHQGAAAQTAAQQSPQSHWLMNHQVTEMWSGPSEEPGAVSFGKTSSRSCVFQSWAQQGDRLYVFNPYSENYFWIDRAAVGPYRDT